MAEVGVGGEVQGDTPEVPPNPRIGAEGDILMMNITSGMPHKQLALVEG